MTTSVALLRGINVGGANKVPMKDLKAMATNRNWNTVNKLHALMAG